MRRKTTTRLARAGLAVPVAIAALALAGCGGGSGPSVSGPPTVVTKHLDGYGTVLATASGQALYLLTSDPRNGSRCTGSCTVRWHPLLDAATPAAGSGVQQSLLSTFRRSDGTRQVTYDGHPLYTYSGAGEGAGAGLESDGGVWYLVARSGKAIERTMSGGY